MLRPDGLLHAWTDVEEYFEVMTALVAENSHYLALPTPAERPPLHDMDYHTSFERKKRKLGLPIFRACWKRGHTERDVRNRPAVRELHGIPIQIGRSYKEWWFLALILAAASLLAGGSLLFVVKHPLRPRRADRRGRSRLQRACACSLPAADSRSRSPLTDFASATAGESANSATTG